MRPKDWLDSIGVSPAAFAKKHKVAHSTISRYIFGNLPPSFWVIALFDEASRGKITIKDWKKVYPKWKASKRGRGKRHT